MGLTHSRVVQTPESLQPNVRRQATFNRIQTRLSRDAQHQAESQALECARSLLRLSLSHLSLLLRPGTIRINPALDLSQPLLVLMNHRDYSNHSANEDPHDRHQQSVQTKNSIHNVIHPLPSATKATDSRFGGADRDRTGGLLVANQALSQLSYSPITPVVSDQLPVVRNSF